MLTTLTLTYRAASIAGRIPQEVRLLIKDQAEQKIRMQIWRYLQMSVYTQTWEQVDVSIYQALRRGPV